MGKESLYKRLAGLDGGISSAYRSGAEGSALSPKDRHTLDYIKGLARDGLFSKKDLTAAELIDQAHQHNLSDNALRRGGIQTDSSRSLSHRLVLRLWVHNADLPVVTCHTTTIFMRL
ncbi:MAG: hypothetical protein U0103_17655 [Candidatus Obscuribacterales bacterium]